MTQRIHDSRTRCGVVVLILFFGTMARATSITDLGSVYSLTNWGQVDTPGGDSDIYRITLSIDPLNYTGDHSDYIRVVAPKISSSLISASLISAPGDVSFWTTFTGGANSKGCSGNGSGFFCSQDGVTAQVSAAPLGGYTWQWDVTIPVGSLLTGTLADSIKAEYYSTRGKFTNQTSQAITLDPCSGAGCLSSPGAPQLNVTTMAPVPIAPVAEPPSILLLGTGMLVLFTYARRHREAPAVTHSAKQ